MTRLWTIVALTWALIPFANGCAVEEDPGPVGIVSELPADDDSRDDDDDTDVVDDVETGACTVGDTRNCKVQIDENNCFVGVQECVLDAWSDCLDAEQLGSGK